MDDEEFFYALRLAARYYARKSYPLFRRNVGAVHPRVAERCDKFADDAAAAKVIERRSDDALSGVRVRDRPVSFID